MPQAFFVHKALLFLSLLSSCVPKEESEQEKVTKIDRLDEEGAKKPLKRTMHISHYYGAKDTLVDTTYAIGYYEKMADERRYQINCSTDDSVVNVIFLLDSSRVVKRSYYYPSRDSFRVIHLINAPQFVFSYTPKQLNPDTIPFLIPEDKALIKRLLKLK